MPDPPFAGGIQSAYHAQYSGNDLGITHIVDASGYDYHKQSSKFTYLVVPVVDQPKANIQLHFARCNAFIDKARTSGSVLVHCVAGISRCCALIAAYLMWKFGMSAAAAVEAVQRVRSTAKPNAGFLKQLERYEVLLAEGTVVSPAAELRKRSSVTDSAASSSDAGAAVSEVTDPSEPGDSAIVEDVPRPSESTS